MGVQLLLGMMEIVDVGAQILQAQAPPILEMEIYTVIVQVVRSLQEALPTPMLAVSALV